MLSHSNAYLIFEKLIMYFDHLTSEQYTETDSLISEDFALEVRF